MYVYLIFPVSAPGKFIYRVPGPLASLARPGARAFAELKNRKCWGFILGPASPEGLKRIKDVLRIEEGAFSLSPAFLKFLTWLWEYYFAEPGDVLRTALPRFLEKHLDGRQEEQEGPEAETTAPPASPLTPGQDGVRRAVVSSLLKREQATYLLQGVTGSGKTHVYFEIAKEALGRGLGVLIMVPEISLTPQMADGCRRVFGERVALYHSGLTDRERRLNWLDLTAGRKNLLVGVRSAVFAPVRDLGLIIVDEEHDVSYSQSERNFNFNARDAAVMRGRIENAVVLLGSATPSVESRYNADQGKYRLLTLKERFNRRPLPSVHLVDMRLERENGNWSVFSALLLERLSERIRKGEQAILLKNRRGFAHFLQCRECGYIPKCPHCNFSLTFHKSTGRMVCHYCERREEPPARCPGCRGVNIRAAGAGTEKVEEELNKAFPGVKTLRLDLDTTSRRGSAEKILADFRAGRAQVLVGTQMVSKGLDFSRVTLVGIVLADTGLFLPDFHASERVFQLLTQVAGRSGRGEATGEVVLQTYAPGDTAIRHAVGQDYEAFYRTELSHRQELSFPPFSRGALVRFLSRDEEASAAAGAAFAALLGKPPDLSVLGPAPSPLYKIRNLYRHFIYIRGKSSAILHDRLCVAFARYGAGKGFKARVQVFMDPATLL